MKLFTTLVISALLAGCTPKEDKAAQAVVEELEHALEAKDADEVMTLLRYPFGGRPQDHEKTRELIEEYFAKRPKIDLGVDIERIRTDANFGEVNLTVQGFHGDKISALDLIRVTLHLERVEEEKWQVTILDWQAPHMKQSARW